MVNYKDLITPGGSHIDGNPPASAAETRILEVSPNASLVGRMDHSIILIDDSSCSSISQVYERERFLEEETDTKVVFPSVVESGDSAWPTLNPPLKSVPAPFRSLSARTLGALVPGKDNDASVSNPERNALPVGRTIPLALRAGALNSGSELQLSKGQRKRRKKREAKECKEATTAEGISVGAISSPAATAKRVRSVEVTPTETGLSASAGTAASSNGKPRGKKIKTFDTSETPRSLPNQCAAGALAPRSNCASVSVSTIAGDRPTTSTGGAGGAVSYSEAATKALPVAVIGLQGNDPKMNDAELKHCTDHLWKSVSSGGSCANARSFETRDGIIRVSCSSQANYDWIVAAVANIPCLGKSLFAVRSGEPLKLRRAKCWIPGPIRRTAEVLACFRAQNEGINTSRWRIYSHLSERSPENMEGSSLTVGLDQSSCDVMLSKYNNQLSLFFGRIKFRFSN